MAKDVTLRQDRRDKSPEQLRSQWRWTVAAMIFVATFLVLAITTALIFGLISPYTTGGSVNP